MSKPDYEAGSAADPKAFVPEADAESPPNGGHVLQSSEETPGEGSAANAHVPESVEETPGEGGRPDAKKKAAHKDAVNIPVEQSEAVKKGELA